MYDQTFMLGSAVSVRIAPSKYCLASSLSPFLLAIRARPYIAAPLFGSKLERTFANVVWALDISPALNAVSASFNKSRTGSGGGSGGSWGTSGRATVFWGNT